MRVDRKYKRYTPEDKGVLLAWVNTVTFYKKLDKDDNDNIYFDEIVMNDYEFNESELNECMMKYINGEYEVYEDEDSYGYITLNNGGCAYFYLGDGIENNEIDIIPSDDYENIDINDYFPEGYEPTDEELKEFYQKFIEGNL